MFVIVWVLLSVAFGVGVLEVQELFKPEFTKNGTARFGFNLDMSASWLVVGANMDGTKFPNGGAVYIYKVGSGGIYNYHQSLYANTSNTELGYLVRISADRLAVGAPYDDNEESDAGSMSIFSLRDDLVWTLDQYIPNPNPRANDNFGQVLDLSSDILVVSSPSATQNCHIYVGRAYFFEYTSNNAFELLEAITPNDAGSYDIFGTAVALRARVVAIGAGDADAAGHENSGAVYIYERSMRGGNWQQIQKLIIEVNDTKLGKSLHFTSSQLVIGAPGPSYLFALSRRNDSNLFEFDQALPAVDGGRVGAGDCIRSLGRDVLLVGGVKDGAGLVYLWVGDNNSQWEYNQIINSSGIVAGDGFSRACAAYGHKVAVGAYLSAKSNQEEGAVYVFDVFGTSNSSACSPYQVLRGLDYSCAYCDLGYMPDESQSSCVRCPSGNAASPDGGCAPCPSGTIPSNGSRYCENCPVGKFSLSGSSFCEECPDPNQIIVNPPDGDDLFCALCPSDSRPSPDRKKCISNDVKDKDSKKGDVNVGGIIGGAVSGSFIVFVLLCCLCGIILLCFFVTLFVIILAVLFLLVVIIVIVVIALSSGVIVKLRKSNKEFDLTVFDGYEGVAVADGLERDFRELVYEDLTFEDKIGEGAFGRVFIGRWRQSTVVAIKELNVQADDKAKREFIHEANVMARLGNHPNVIHFIGAVTTQERFYMITEFAQNGSLWDYMKNQNGLLSTTLVTQFLIDAASGLVHLHAEGIVHRDIASRNFLVSKDLTVMVADFGMSRIVDDTENVQSTKYSLGPIRWMAPETMKKREYSAASDVYMFGMFMYELLTGQVPFEDLNLQDVLLAVSERFMRPAIPETIPAHFTAIMKHCWHGNPKFRPNMLEVHTRLSDTRPLSSIKSDPLPTTSAQEYDSLRNTADKALTYVGMPVESDALEKEVDEELEKLENEAREEMHAWKECEEIKMKLEQLRKENEKSEN